jgi:hypothetical protein
VANRQVVLLEKHITHGHQGQFHSWEIQVSQLDSNSRGDQNKEVQLISVIERPIFSVIPDSRQDFYK